MGLRLGVLAEAVPGEHRVALTPDAVTRLRAAGFSASVQAGAGRHAWSSDEDYAQAGADVVAAADVLAAADLIVTIGPVPAEQLRPGQALVGLLQPLLDPSRMQAYALRGVTALSLDGLPRTLSRAQTMDALSSQANVAGYKAVLVAASSFGRFFPMLITAAGTAKPAEVLVLGAGVAGLQAIGTARRLGAVVRAYDVRPASQGEVESLGAHFVQLTSVESGVGEGGYARVLNEEEQAAQQAELSSHIAKHDVVITTAQVPGRRPPVMVTADAIKNMRAGSVIVDMAASLLGGNVEGSQPEGTIVTPNGVTVIGAGSLPSAMATSASAAYARNITAFLLHVTKDAELAIDPDDEIQRGVLITFDGKVVHPATAALLDASAPSAPAHPASNGP